MASPTVATTNSTSISVAADPWGTVNLPASIAAGDLLVVFGRTGGAQTFNLPTGWNWAIQNDVSDANDDATSVIYKVANGGEGASFSWDMSGSAKGASIAYRIAGHNGGFQVIPTPTTFTTAANSADPPTTGTIPSDDYLIIVFAGCDGESVTFTAPTNYGSIINQNSGTGGAVATNCRIASAVRSPTGITSEDPGTFTHGATAIGGTAITLAIRQLVTVSAQFKRHRQGFQAVNRGANW